MRIVNPRRLRERIEELLDKKEYEVRMNKDDKKVGIRARLHDHPIAQVRYNEADYSTIIVEEIPWNNSDMETYKRDFKELKEEGHLQFVESHRAKLQEMAGHLERRIESGHISDEDMNTKVVYIEHSL